MQSDLFDAVEADRLKEEGMARAANTRADILKIAKDSAYRLALRHNDVTVDDVYAYMESMAAWPSLLGNSAGSIFKGKSWEFTGEWRKSTRVSNHGRMVRVWRMKA